VRGIAHNPSDHLDIGWMLDNAVLHAIHIAQLERGASLLRRRSIPLQDFRRCDGVIGIRQATWTRRAGISTSVAH